MLKLLGDLKTYLKWQEIVTANFIFRLHNSFTAAVLLACSLVITATQYVGSPIECITDSLSKEQLKPATTFCWITSTFSMPYSMNGKPGYDNVLPGIINEYGTGEKRFHAYYQWVCFALFFQAAFCYLPKFLWDTWEQGLLSNLVMGMKLGICDNNEICKKKDKLITYFMSHLKLHNMYAIKYWFCEMLCLLNVISQMYFMNYFFGNEFLTYGWNAVNFLDMRQEDRIDPMAYVFPRITKCTFHKYGPSGSIQRHDLMCVLPLNIVNEKTYVFIWFWFVTLFFLLSALIIYRCFIIACPFIRPYLLRTQNTRLSSEVATSISRKVGVGDWWIIYMLSHNIDSRIFRELLLELTKQI